jgi:hypothetical protein
MRKGVECWSWGMHIAWWWGNTLFKRAPARLITYRSGENMLMIDYVMVKSKDRKYVKNVKAIPGMLQHSLVVMDVVLK